MRFPWPDINDPSLSMEHGGAGDTAAEYRAECSHGALSKGYEPERCAACGYSDAASQWGEKQTKWKSNWNFKVPRTYAPVLLTLIWYSDKLLFEIQWNAPRDKNETKEVQESEKDRELHWVALKHPCAFDIWGAYKYTVPVCVWQAVMKQKHNLNALMFSLQSNTQRCAGRGEREMKDRKSIWEIWEQISDGCLCVCVRVCVCTCVCVC